MTSPLCVATGGWCRRVFHYRPPTPMYRNSPPLCTIVLQIPSLMPLKMRKVQLSAVSRRRKHHGYVVQNAVRVGHTGCTPLSIALWVMWYVGPTGVITDSYRTMPRMESRQRVLFSPLRLFLRSFPPLLAVHRASGPVRWKFRCVRWLKASSSFVHCRSHFGQKTYRSVHSSSSARLNTMSAILCIRSRGS